VNNSSIKDLPRPRGQLALQQHLSSYAVGTEVNVLKIFRRRPFGATNSMVAVRAAWRPAQPYQ
jgi:hypothetical protein